MPMAILDHKFDHIKFSPKSQSAELFWKVLVIDDEKAIHDTTAMALKGLSFNGKSLSMLHAYSRDTAKKIIQKNLNIALILLDIALETQEAGFDLIHWIRKEQKNTCVQIVIHTGNSDIFIEQDIVETYDINDYLAKTDATFQRLQTLVKKSIRSFKTQSALENELAHTKKIEQQLKEKEQLISQLGHAQRLEAMGTLAGGIAHDFNNILGGILGYAQLLQFELKNNQTGISYTNQIVSGCNRAKNLVLQILDFSRQRETISPPGLANPVEIVQKTINLLRASIPSSIKIHSEIAQDVGYILADPSQIHQAVMNLCTNARQAIENSMGQITIQVKKVCLDTKNHIRNPNLNIGFGDFIIISVQDTGKGIELDTLEKIFNPYFTTKDRGDGTGLGLSVVHGIVTRLNGTITTDTCPGKGTTFALYLPTHKEKEKKITKKNSPLIKGEASVLFVDDEPMLVELGKRMLEKLGYNVMATDSPLEALEYIQKEPDRFDIVITDLTMPDMHGTQLAAKIKLINHLIPIVLATGFTNLIQTQKANPSGIDAILPKPITMDSLSQTIHLLLVK